MVKVIYPLIEVKTKVQSEYYTMAVFDLYIHNKVKYVRGKPMFFADDPEDRGEGYKHISEMPKVIEELDMSTWKCKCSEQYRSISSADYIASVASYHMLTGK